MKSVLAVIQKRIARFLKKKGYLEEKEECVIQTADLWGNTVENLCRGASVRQLIALGERAGQRVEGLGASAKEEKAVLK